MRRHGIIVVFIGLIFAIVGSVPDMIVLAQGTNTVSANVIIEALRAGEGVDLVNAQVQCARGEALDFTVLADADANRLVINSPIKITDSVIECDVIATRGETEPLDVRFRETVNFTGTRFVGRVNVASVDFDKGVNFTDARFGGGANFNGTVFEQATSFDRAVFSSIAPFFIQTRFESEASFLAASFESGYGLTFTQVFFADGATFADAVFTSPITFTDVDFETAADFSNAQWASASFTGVDFGDTASFRLINSEGDLTFDMVHVAGDTTFEQATLNGKVKFTNTDFQGAARFPNVTFADSFHMINSSVGGEAVFENSLFSGEVTLTASTFSGSTRFRGATFQKNVSLANTNLGSFTSFRDVDFRGDVSSDTTSFGGESTFENALFTQSATFSGTEFLDPAQFTRAVFRERAEFINVSFTSSASFRSTEFRDGVVFRSSDFDVLNLTSIAIDNQELDLFDSTYNQLVAHDFDFEWIKTSTDDFNTAFAIGIFADLEANFRGQGRETLANEAYLRKWQTECDITGFWSPLGLGCLMGRGIGFLVQPWDVIELSVAIYAIFAVVYIVFGVQRRFDRSESVEIKFARQKDGRLLLVPASSQEKTEPSDPSPPSIWDRIKSSLELSFVAFLYIRRPKGQAPYSTNWAMNLLVQTIITVEWILGYYALIGLAMTIANTAPLFGEFVSQFR